MGEREAMEYNEKVERIRKTEYPMLAGTTYLDHAGTTLYAKSLIERFSASMISNLYGNPHSASTSSQLSTRRIEDIRLRLLSLFNADPETFDVVFVANATAGIKLVADGFRDHGTGFWYGYHRDAHTSLVGVRELAQKHRCFGTDADVESWLEKPEELDIAALFAYPAQSNMTGYRLPLDWCRRIRALSQESPRRIFTLLDAAALVSTSRLDLNDSEVAPDFTVLSLHKIFGFPDLGALIVRKESGTILESRKYFGGGTVDMVLCLREQWHAKKSDTLHDRLEDGTLPIHSIMALDAAMDVHEKLFESLDRIAQHTAFLAKRLYDGLSSLRHGNGRSVCKIYKESSSVYGDPHSQGPIVSFNIRNSEEAWVSNGEFEKLTTVKDIQVRTGGVCNPAGISSYLGLAPWEMRENFSAGQRCGNEYDILGGKPTGVIRVSLGAMSTIRDIDNFLDFIHDFFVDLTAVSDTEVNYPLTLPRELASFYVESLTVYPIKSCAGWKIPVNTPWEIRDVGLAWDREWCLVHAGTGTALSQKRYPRMALIRPSIDLVDGVMRVRVVGSEHEISVPLSANPTYFVEEDGFRSRTTNVCGDTITANEYKSEGLSDYFTQALGVACRLARFPSVGNSALSSRHSKAHLQQHQRSSTRNMPGAFPDGRIAEEVMTRPILLSNESPILTISRSSLNRLNEQIKMSGGKAAQAEVFRANIVVAEDLRSVPGTEQPYVEDSWRYMQIGNQYFQMLGSCRRCQMVCVDQETAIKNQEPFVTLVKTRRFDGKVYFGQHTCHIQGLAESSTSAQYPTIKVGDAVQSFGVDDDLERFRSGQVG
ncbi:molybdenum cofactor sulfurase protein-like protein [Patellaria atrata CBS 101060]|uniref:Molybdenum cofactor sulfurase n=1 Tax=Patellaria atrata CBS 101060 TaxID=1346257 RepID=A0A9P4SJH6_9PEZI|nr:molybdenum cofactor sulfurase protein-like protein [Patellaria atrata CBS 101060]